MQQRCSPHPEASSLNNLAHREPSEQCQYTAHTLSTPLFLATGTTTAPLELAPYLSLSGLPACAYVLASPTLVFRSTLYALLALQYAQPSAILLTGLLRVSVRGDFLDGQSISRLSYLRCVIGTRLASFGFISPFAGEVFWRPMYAIAILCHGIISLALLRHNLPQWLGGSPFTTARAHCMPERKSLPRATSRTR